MAANISAYSADKHRLNTLFAFCVFCVFWVVFGLLKVHFLLEKSLQDNAFLVIFAHTKSNVNDRMI